MTDDCRSGRAGQYGELPFRKQNGVFVLNRGIQATRTTPVGHTCRFLDQMTRTLIGNWNC